MHDTATTLQSLATKLREGAEFGFAPNLKVTLAGRQALVENARAIANEVDALADEARVRDIDRGEFEGLMIRFRLLGKRTPRRWVNAVENAIGATIRRAAR